MKKNTGNSDKIIRIILALILGSLYFTNTVNGTIGIILLVIAIVLLLTSFISFCPLYKIFGINTCKNCSIKRNK